MTKETIEAYEAGYAAALKEMDRRLGLLRKGESNSYYLVAYDRIKACLKAMVANLHLREIERRKA